jgi:5-hydroxyisourate hydrolase
MTALPCANRRAPLMNGKLTTHVLDTAQGTPAAGMGVRLYRLDGARAALIVEAATDSNGRCPAPLLEGETLTAGRYRLVFAAGDYFRAHGVTLSNPPFLDEIAIDFGVADSSAHYHVPLLVSPWSYTTYRGS